MNFATLIGACKTTRNSRRGIQTASLTCSVTYTASYTGTRPRSVSISGSATNAWTRVPLPPGLAHLGDVPGAGNFFLADPECCCPCRAIFAFDDATLNEFAPAAGVLQLPITATLVDAGETSPLARLVTVELWNAASPPCRKADGPPTPGLSPRIIVRIPFEFLHADNDPATDTPVEPVISLAGGHAPIILDLSLFTDVNNLVFGFDAPAPCSDDQHYTLTVGSIWTGAQMTASASVVVGVTLSA